MNNKGEGDKRAFAAMRWKGRTHFNFLAGRSRLRALPVVVHLLPNDIDWFSKDPTLFHELQSLLRDNVISTTHSGERDPEAPKSRKRARKEEICIQGTRLQFTYRYRNTLPRYSVLSYEEDHGTVPLGKDNTDGTAGNRGPRFRRYPLSDSTLLVWVYRFNADDPYATIPNEAALQFAPPTKPPSAQALDPEAVGRDLGGPTEGVEMQAAPRDTGLLAWLWGSDRGDGGAKAGRDDRGVRQHFIGSAAWEGRPANQRGREEDDDIQRAIALSLATAARNGQGGEGADADQDFVEVLDGDNEGLKESNY